MCLSVCYGPVTAASLPRCGVLVLTVLRGKQPGQGLLGALQSGFGVSPRHEPGRTPHAATAGTLKPGSAPSPGRVAALAALQPAAQPLLPLINSASAPAVVARA